MKKSDGRRNILFLPSDLEHWVVNANHAPALE
jgi:hypothetical protein